MEENKEHGEWKQIIEWKGVNYEAEKYEVSSFGQIRRFTGKNQTGLYLLKKPTLLKPGLNNRGMGYCFVYLYKNNKSQRVSVHRIVAFYFVTNPNPNDYVWVDHIDQNSRNNHFSNLRWCSPHLNHLNMRVQPNSLSGIKGVTPGKNGRWRARIQVHGKQYGFGTFKNIEDAILARKKAHEEHFNSEFYTNN